MTLFANLPGWSSKFAAENAAKEPPVNRATPPKRNWGANDSQRFGAQANGYYNPGYFFFDGSATKSSVTEAGSDTAESASQPTPTPTPPAPPLPESPSASSLATSALALESEIAWVRSGGVLRDAHGRRDIARTAQIREQLAREAEEKRVIDAWRAYEDSWTRLLATSAGASPSTPIQFEDIPWPVTPPLAASPPASSKPQQPETRPVEIQDITLTAVRAFLFSTLALSPSHAFWSQHRGGRPSERQIVKASLLRWHPDKLGGVMCRVGLPRQDGMEDIGQGMEAEVRRVKEGVNTVVECLKHLKEELS